jgi:hypothetical protein
MYDLDDTRAVEGVGDLETSTPPLWKFVVALTLSGLVLWGTLKIVDHWNEERA